MAQFAVLIYAADSAHPHAADGSTESSPSDSAGPARQECDDHAAAIAAEGVMTGAWALTPRADARSIRADGVRDAPFLDGAPVVAGFYLLEAPSREDALAIAARNPAIAAGGGVEVRPVHSGGWIGTPAPL